MLGNPGHSGSVSKGCRTADRPACCHDRYDAGRALAYSWISGGWLWTPTAVEYGITSYGDHRPISEIMGSGGCPVFGPSLELSSARHRRGKREPDM
jgi:hypothetical protein